MRKSLWIMLAVMVVAVSAPNAHADGFTWSFVGSSGTGSGTFTATPVSGTDHDLVTAITGTFGGQTITGLLAAGTTGPLGSTDNLIFPAGDGPGFPGAADVFFTPLGLGFSTGSGENFLDNDGFLCSFSSCSGITTAWVPSGGSLFGAGGTFTLTPVTAPEPASLLLAGTGLLGVAGIKRRRSGC